MAIRLHTFFANVAKARREVLEGKSYLVAPIVMIVQGVHAANEGPVYYSEAVLKKTAPLWDKKPITVYHPQINGEYVSASEPALQGKRTIGFLQNSSYDKNSVAEGWFDEEKTKAVDPRVYAAVESGSEIEVSTGMFGEMADVKGVFNGVAYTKEALELYPDHLAILPDKEGACSIKKGCGCNIRNEGINVDKNAKVTTIINAGIGWEEGDRTTLMGLPDAKIDLLHQKHKPAPTPIANNTPAPAAPPTLEQLVAASDPHTRAFFQQGIEAGKQMKAQLIANIKAAPNNRFTDEYLNGIQDMTLLQGIAEMARPAAQPAAPAAPISQSVPVLLNSANPAFTPPPVLEPPSIFSVKS